MTGSFNGSGTLYSDNKKQLVFSRLFENCEQLLTGPNILIKEGNNQQLFYTFNNCINMTSIGNITFNAGWKIIYNTFLNCSKLEKVGTIKCLSTAESSTKRFGLTGLFKNCYSLKKTPKFINCYSTGTDSELFRETFYNCSSLIDIRSLNDMINENLNTEIGNSSHMFENAFYGCTSLTGRIRIFTTWYKFKKIYL